MRRDRRRRGRIFHEVLSNVYDPGGIVLAVVILSCWRALAMLVIFLLIVAMPTAAGFIFTVATVSWWPTGIGFIIGVAWLVCTIFTERIGDWQEKREKRSRARCQSRGPRRWQHRRWERQWQRDLARARRMGLLQHAEPASERML
jgi:hypothetical protein